MNRREIWDRPFMIPELFDEDARRFSELGIAAEKAAAETLAAFEELGAELERQAAETIRHSPWLD